MPDFQHAFDLSNGYNILRIICGAFLVPHFLMKASDISGSVAVYRSWRLMPPRAWVYACLVVEVIGAVGLVFGIYTRAVAILVAIFLLVATWAVWRHSNGKWHWNLGGIEYPLFWAICCVVVAMQS